MMILGRLIYLLSALAIFVVYLPTLVPLHVRWSANETYSHGYLVIAMVAYGIYQLSRENEKSDGPALLPLFLALLLSAIWIAGFAVQVQVLQQIILPLIIYVWIAALFGWRFSLKYIPPILFLYLIIPLWGFLTPSLRLMTVRSVEVGVELLSIPALIDGYNIYLPSGTLRVAGGCSGLNYLLASLVIGIYFAYSAYSQWIKRVLVVTSIILVAIVGNWIRVFVLVLLGHYTEMQSPIIADHGTLGWVVYAVFLGLFFVVVPKVIKPSDSDGQSSDDRDGDSAMTTSSSSDLSETGTSDSVQKFDYKVACVCVLVTGIFIASPLWVGAVDKSNASDLTLLVSSIGEFEKKGSHISGKHWRPAYEGYDYAFEGGRSLNGFDYELTVLTYVNQAQGKELIYYKNVLASEYDISHLDPVELVGIVSDNANTEHARFINRAVVKTPEGRRIVWWGYSVGGRFTNINWKAKLLQIPALLQGNPQASLFVISTLCRTSNCENEYSSTGNNSEHMAIINDFVQNYRVE